MDEAWDVTVLVVPPAGVGPVLLAGAASVVASLLMDLDLECDHYIEQAEPDGAGVVLIGVLGDGRSEQELTELVTGAIQAMLRDTPELAGWGHRVTADAAGSDDDLPGADDLDEEAARLVPDGEALAEQLMHAIAYERSVYDDARLFTAWPLEDLVVADLDAVPEREREVVLRRASALAGCLIHASVTVVDHLFEDIEELRGAKRGHGMAPAIDDLWVLADLPPRFAHRYGPLFAQEFLVSFVDLTARLTGEWTPPACVAQELGLRVLLDAVENVAESADVELEDGWRSHLEELLFEDLDHELLYDPAADGFEDAPAAQPLGMASMRFEDWFTPFNDGYHLPPYALPSEPIGPSGS